MTIEEFNALREKHNEGQRKKPVHNESKLQRACVRWFRLQYSNIANMLFSVPNGGARTKIEAKIMKAEGVVPGVSDLILLIGRKGYNALCLECKFDKGKQTEAQKLWQSECEKNGSKYVVFRTFESFQEEVDDYLR